MKKILIFSTNPKYTENLGLDKEVREIQKALEKSRNREQFEIFTFPAMGFEDLRRTLLEHQPTIVHFSGHGSGVEGLALENNSGEIQLVSAESLTKLFGFFQSQIECVFLNACYSRAQAEIIRQHIGYVLGINRDMGDFAAIEFTIRFYDALFAGRSYEECFEIGRVSIDLEGIPEHLTPQIKVRRWSYFDKAIADYSQAIKLNPKYTVAYYNRGYTYYNKGEFDKAIADFNQAIELDIKYTIAYNNRGDVYNNKKEYDKAIADFNNAIKLDPKFANAYKKRGDVYYNQGDFDKAITDYSKAIELDPKYTIAYNNRGYAYTNKGEFDKAIADYNQSIKLESKKYIHLQRLQSCLQQ